MTLVLSELILEAQSFCSLIDTGVNYLSCQNGLKLIYFLQENFKIKLNFKEVM